MLESRLLLATDTWTGIGNTLFLDPSWTNPSNWNHGAPVAGEDLVFPNLVSAFKKDNDNDFAAGTTFNSITLTGGGYTLVGNALQLTSGLTNNYSLNPNTVSLNGITLRADQTFLAEAGILTIHAPIDLTEHNLTLDGSSGSLSGNISGSGNLNKNGPGVWSISGNNSYTGATNINAGKAVMAGTIQGPMTIASGATLVPGTLTAIGATTPATFTTGPLTFSSGSTLVETINNIGAGTDYSQVVANGAVNLNGANLTINQGFTPAPKSEFVPLKSTGPITGTFDGLASGEILSSSSPLVIDYTTSQVVFCAGPVNTLITLTSS
jgi:autotransporter-associated beta strand protein